MIRNILSFLSLSLLLACQTSSQKDIKASMNYNLILAHDNFQGIPIYQIDIGKLSVPTGRIVVCDPLVYPDMPPLKRSIPPGQYPITIYVAETEEMGHRYALVELRLKNEAAEKWVLAVWADEDTAEKETLPITAFPVDAGLGAMFDAESAVLYERFEAQFYQKHPDGNLYDDFFAAEFKKNAVEPDNPNDIGDWINFTLPESDLNLTMFHSGYGDGLYSAYWGMRENGEVVSLLIDFQVLP